LSAALGLTGSLTAVVPASAESGVISAEVFTSCDDGGTLTVSMRNGTDVTQRILFDVDKGNDGTPDFGDGAEVVPKGRVDLPITGRGDGTYRVTVMTESGVEVAESVVEIACGRPSARYYVTKYDQTVWRVTDSEVRALTYVEWQADGAPTPEPAPTDYVRYSWSSTISAVTFFGQARERWVWKHVSFDEWSRAGRPSPRTAGWIDGSVFYQWGTSDQIFVQDVGGVRHALSYAEWRDSGFEPYERRATQGFVKLTWDNSIAFLSDIQGGQGGPIGYDRWSGEGFPAPATAPRFNGDQVYRNWGSPDIWYAGPTTNRRINGSEWAAMGNPYAPWRNVPASPGDTKNCSDFSTQRDAQAAFDYWYPAYGDVFKLDRDNDFVACEEFKY
jgi:hypothetical protein